MSLTLNMVGGGGDGGLLPTDAILRVQAPAGSTVTITKGTTTKTDQGHENIIDPTIYDYYFIVHQSQFDSVNPWTVTATLGGQTYTGSVVIDQNDEYDVDLTTTLILYNAGDQCIQVTGGWAAYPYPVTTSYGFQAVDPTFASAYIQFSTSTQPRSCAASTNNAINVSRYNTLKIIASGTYDYLQWGLRSTNTGTYDENFVASKSNSFDPLDISALTGSYYFLFGPYTASASKMVNVQLSKVWLE